jgi:Protein of unknown function (DUF992)
VLKLRNHFPKGKTLRIPLILGCAALAAMTLAPVGASAAVKVGTLRCNVSGGLGLIVTSKKELSCVYRSNRGYSERYVGSIRKYGLDIGKTSRGVMVWGVFTETDGRQHGMLGGDYNGVQASATVGAGVGANALVGGSNSAVTLQPFSAQAQTGLSLAAGVASLSLRPAR